MTVRHVKDVVHFQLSTVEMRQVMEEGGMIHAIAERLSLDLSRGAKAGRWIPHSAPVRIFHESQGRGHVLQCRVHAWTYFREVEAASPLEREIRAEMLALGLSGEADRRAARYSPA